MIRARYLNIEGETKIEDPKGHSDAIVAIEHLLKVIQNSQGM